MILEEGLLQFLQAQSAIMAMVGPNGIYMNSVPEGAHDPSLCFSTISSNPDAGFEGPSGYNIRRYQFESFSTQWVNCLKLDNLLRLAIDGYVGTLPNGQRVFNIIRANELDGYDDLNTFGRRITDYYIHFAE